MHASGFARAQSPTEIPRRDSGGTHQDACPAPSSDRPLGPQPRALLRCCPRYLPQAEFARRGSDSICPLWPIDSYAIIYTMRACASIRGAATGALRQRVHVANIGETIPKACGFEAATLFSLILHGGHPHPDCRYRDEDGSFCRLPTKMTCTPSPLRQLGNCFRLTSKRWVCICPILNLVRNIADEWNHTYISAGRNPA